MTGVQTCALPIYSLDYLNYPVYMFLFFFLFWLLWVFVAVRRLSLVAASGGYSSFVVCVLLSVVASLVVECGL